MDLASFAPYVLRLCPSYLIDTRATSFGHFTVHLMGPSSAQALDPSIDLSTDRQTDR